MLTPIQKRAAQRMFNYRPLVIPGTRVIANQQEREAWYRRVTLTMQRYGIKGQSNIDVFCNIAGVPD